MKWIIIFFILLSSIIHAQDNLSPFFKQELLKILDIDIITPTPLALPSVQPDVLFTTDGTIIPFEDPVWQKANAYGDSKNWTYQFNLWFYCGYFATANTLDFFTSQSQPRFMFNYEVSWKKLSLGFTFDPINIGGYSYTLHQPRILFRNAEYLVPMVDLRGGTFSLALRY